MAHRKVSIYLYGKTPDGIWKYLKPAIGTNNKIRPGYGVLHGNATKLDDGWQMRMHTSVSVLKFRLLKPHSAPPQCRLSVQRPRTG
jgi:hypothetical protein